ncbi:hypothetical protein GGI24_004247, partial [Coemansia furcata]
MPMKGIVSKPTGADVTQDLARGLKHELKTWEGAFQDKHGRAPEKSDLSLFPEVSEKYRRYSKLKRISGRCGSKGAAVRTGGEHPQSENDILSNTSDMQAMFPLATSTLTMSLKRKTTTASTRNSILEPPASTLQQPHIADRCQSEEGQEQPASQPDSDPDDAVNATPKRQRTSMFFSAAWIDSNMSRGARRGSLASSRQGDNGHEQEEVFAAGNTGGFNGDDWDKVAYVPPPSLIRRYTQQRSRTTATASATSGQEPLPGTPRSVHSPLLSSFGVMSVSEQTFPDNAYDRVSGPMRALDLGIAVPSYKARAGKLVKTTSIPLSTFGAQLGGVSHIMTSHGHLSDAGDDAGCTLDASELVVDEREAVTTASSSTHKKKATQKRSTRRVKLKPVGKDGSVATVGRSGRGDTQHLVSNNFYKLKMKGGRRGPQSADERRTALYKRMIGKKSGGVAGAVPGTLANDNDRGSLLGMDDIYEGGETGGSDGV